MFAFSKIDLDCYTLLHVCHTVWCNCGGWHSCRNAAWPNTICVHTATVLFKCGIEHDILPTSPFPEHYKVTDPETDEVMFKTQLVCNATIFDGQSIICL